jgi:hypothetical protein
MGIIEGCDTYIEDLSLLLVCSLIIVVVLSVVSLGSGSFSELAQMMISSLIARENNGTHKQGLLSPFKSSIVNHRVTQRLSQYVCCTHMVRSTMINNTTMYGSSDHLPKSIVDLDRGRE